MMNLNLNHSENEPISPPPCSAAQAKRELEGAKDLIGWKDVEASRIKHREGVSPEQRKRGKIEASLDSLLFHSRY